MPLRPRHCVLAALIHAAAWSSFAAEPAEIVAKLASPECAGRLAGSDGERLAVAMLVRELAAMGAVPLPGSSDFARPVPLALPLSGAGSNVAGWFPPKDPAAGTALLCAHHDHLGDGRVLRGASLPGEVGRLHPGADDNASGVAAALQATRLLANHPQRTVGVLVLFTTAEESECQGARAFVREWSGAPPTLAINMDQVGKLGSGGLAWEWAGAADASSADSAPPFFARAAEAAGVILEAGNGFSRRGDGVVLADAGIPTLCLYTGPHDDVHRPTDTADKLDYAGIQRIAALAALAVIEAQADPPKAAE